MSFPTMNDDMNIIAKLGDEPNEDDGLSAAGLKAVFDEAGKRCKAAINALVEALGNASAAANVGFRRSTAVPADTVQGAIENVQAQIAGVSQGAVANGSLTDEKMRPGGLMADVTSTLTITETGSGAYPTDVSGLVFRLSKALGVMLVSGPVTFRKTGTGLFSARYTITGPYDFGYDDTIFNCRASDGVPFVKVTPLGDELRMEFRLSDVPSDLEENVAFIELSGWLFCGEVT